MEGGRFGHGSHGSDSDRAAGGGLAVGSHGAAPPPHPVASAAGRDGRSRALVQGAQLAWEAAVVGGAHQVAGIGD
jgi:hypothetical protein